MTSTQNTCHLFDADTAADLGPATAAQTEASYAAGVSGIIAVDSDGDVVPTGGFHVGRLRSVYVA